MKISKAFHKGISQLKTLSFATYIPKYSCFSMYLSLMVSFLKTEYFLHFIEITAKHSLRTSDCFL